MKTSLPNTVGCRHVCDMAVFQHLNWEFMKAEGGCQFLKSAFSLSAGKKAFINSLQNVLKRIQLNSVRRAVIHPFCLHVRGSGLPAQDFLSK